MEKTTVQVIEKNYDQFLTSAVNSITVRRSVNQFNPVLSVTGCTCWPSWSRFEVPRPRFVLQMRLDGEKIQEKKLETIDDRSR